MTSIKTLCRLHLEAWQAIQRAPAGVASRMAGKAAQEALEAVCRYPCTSEDDAWELYQHLLWYSIKQGDRMEPHARALFAAMRHTPGPSALAGMADLALPANDWRRG